jgi:hypothetical protein
VSYQQSSLADLLALIQLLQATGDRRETTEASEVSILMNKVQILGPDGTPYRARPSMLTVAAGYLMTPLIRSVINWRTGNRRYGRRTTKSTFIAIALFPVPAIWSVMTGGRTAPLTRLLDNAVGANFRPIMKPDYRVLRMITGNKAFDSTWAEEYGKALEAHWRTWAYDTGRYCDVERKLTFLRCCAWPFAQAY